MIMCLVNNAGRFPEKPLPRLSDEFKQFDADKLSQLLYDYTLKSVFLSPAAEAFRNSYLRMRNSTK